MTRWCLKHQVVKRYRSRYTVGVSHPAVSDLHTMSVRARAFISIDADHQWVTASVVQVGDYVEINEAGPHSHCVAQGTVTAIDRADKVTLTLDGRDVRVVARRYRLWHRTAAQVDYLAERAAVR